MNRCDWAQGTCVVAAATMVAPRVMKRASAVIVVGLAVVMLPARGAGEAPGTSSSSSPGEGAKARILEGYGRLPLRFERSEGQARYVSRGPGYTMFVMPTEMVLSLQQGNRQRTEPLPRPAVLRVKLLKARSAEMQGLDELPGKANYFIGRDPKRWRTDVAGYAKLRCRGVYPGIDLLYYGSGRELEYDFVVAPGGDPTRIRLRFEGAREPTGGRRRATGGRDRRRPCRESRASNLPGGGDEKVPVRGRWILRGKSEAGFEVEAHDPRRSLVIDPVLSYSTYLGGNQEDLATASPWTVRAALTSRA